MQTNYYLQIICPEYKGISSSGGEYKPVIEGKSFNKADMTKSINDLTLLLRKYLCADLEIKCIGNVTNTQQNKGNNFIRPAEVVNTEGTDGA